MIFNTLSNAAYRVSLHGLGAELEGGGTSTPARRVRRRAVARPGLRRQISAVLCYALIFYAFKAHLITVSSCYGFPKAW